MKGVILAGGNGSRLMPVTTVINKNLLPVYNKPAIFYSLELFRKAFIKEVCIVAEHRYIEDFKAVLGNGTDFGLRISYENDSPLKKGPASALMHAKHFVASDSVTVVFADGIYDIDLAKDVKSFKEGAIAFLKKVENPQNYGVYELDEIGRVVSIEEKPANPKSTYAFTGLLIYDKNVFNYLEQLKPGLNNEYYTVDIDKMYLKKGMLKSRIINGFWQDMGTFDGLYKASEYWYNKSHSLDPSFTDSNISL